MMTIHEQFAIAAIVGAVAGLMLAAIGRGEREPERHGGIEDWYGGDGEEDEYAQYDGWEEW